MAATPVPAPIEAPATNGLKHLAFVADAAANASATADSVYKQARPYTPTFAEPYVSKVEDTVAAYTAPVVASAADVGEKLLARADEQVDYVAKTTDYIVTKSKENITSVLDAGKSQLSHGQSTLKELHTSSVNQFTAATQKYLDFLRTLSAWLADKLSPSKNVAWAKDQLHAAIAAVGTATDPDFAIGKVHDAWAAFAAIPIVAKVLSTTEPISKFGTSSFVKTHDTLVGSSYYKRAYDLSAATLSYGASTTPYKLSAKYAYPWVSRVADPALGKLTGSKNLVAAVTYWKPAVVVPKAAAVKSL